MFRRSLPDARASIPGLATLGLTTLAMLAFAANSLLCRIALRGGHIDAASFGALRLLAGALMLALVLMAGRRPRRRFEGDWRSAALLFAYVACFAFAYVTLAAGTGALILFGTVQLTMCGVGLLRGERFAAGGWCGLALAAAGLVILMLPGVAAPSLRGAALMALAGAAWGGYSLLGRGVADPAATTAGNFMRAVPLGLVPAAFFAAHLHTDAAGLLLALASGALTSGLGYVIWYAALRGLTSLQAATLQLSVPLIAAGAGVLVLDEAVTARLLLAAVAILGGIALVLLVGKRRVGKA
jgi:drug/metabolite transporter (DMT)-like permease